MKKLVLFSLALISGNLFANVPFKVVDTCMYDYDNFNFCSKKNISRYKLALKGQKPNFSKDYILLNVGSENSKKYVAINTKTGIVFTLMDDIIGFKDNKGFLTGKPASISYSVNNPELIIRGSVDAYRNSYDNVEMHYTIQNDEFSKYKKSFNRVNLVGEEISTP